MRIKSLEHESSSPTRRMSDIFPRLKISLVAMSLFGLVAVNVLTLVNDGAQAVGYSIVRAAFGSVMTDAVVARVLNGSPAATKQRAVSAATRELQVKTFELERSNFDIEYRRKELEKSHKALETKNATLTKDFKVLSDKHVDLQTTHKELSDRHVDLQRTHKEFEVKHADLEKTHKETETRHAQLKQTSVRRSSLVSTISKRVGKRAAINAAKNASSFALEVIPYVGVAAIATLTISDLYDACQTMKDVNELNVEFELQSEDADKVCGLKIPTLH